MRLLAMLSAAFLLIIASIRSFAQYAQVAPRTLPAEIATQENIVQTEPGRDDPQAWLKLAVLLQDAGSYHESEDAYLHTITHLRNPDPLTVADVFDHMGTMYVESGQLSKAEPVERHALEIREAQHDQLGTGVSHMHLAMLLLGQNKLSSAETEAQSAVNQLVPENSHLGTFSSATPEEKMTALIDRSLVQCASGSCQTAIPSLRAALKIAHKNYSAKSIPVGYTDFLLGYVNWKSGNYISAGKLMRQGTRELAADLGWGHPMYLRTLRQYRAFLLETNQRDKARRVSAEIERLEHSGSAASVASAALKTARNLPR